MRLRDMLAAAVRPLVRVKTSDVALQVDLGEYGVFGPRWSLKIVDTGTRREDVIYLERRSLIDVGRVGDLRITWTSSKTERRRHDEWRAKHIDSAANDSKAAA